MNPSPKISVRVVLAVAGVWVFVLGLLVASSLAQPSGKTGAEKAGAAKPSAAAKTGDKPAAKTKSESPKPETSPETSKEERASEKSKAGSEKTTPEKAIAEIEAAADDEKLDEGPVDYTALLFVFAMATFIGLGVVARVSRLLHTPLMSLTNAISAIAIVGAIIVTGSSSDMTVRIMGAVALFASMTNVVSGFLITDRMLKMFKQTRTEGK